ncbi:enoyl-CoA hydratase-related protein [Nocardia bovistercoris]|uniref:Enoyl-CoA hydratase/isomerase family protein n=1 Tax=Nocardia bovistercoris TaxID=2785916 RepID=A0A931IJK2_9NOCA|nr:enoyl-CoA hydratase-related protein [Nocardia bovistercoris]MBH0780768.1 enoyl-CoA hydratase/isomerase family protein [Nocardia bovistercoris]
MTAPDAEGDDLLIERVGAVTVVRLNRPRARNALTMAMLRGIGAAVVAAEADPTVGALLMVGAGDRAFCSGMDLRAFADGADYTVDDPATAAYMRLTRGEATLPVIGAANGSAIGGGLELLLGADLIIASEAATFAFPEVRRGMFPGGGGTFVATRIPLNIAFEMTLTGDSITAARGYELGLVNAVVAADQVFATAIDYAERIAANAPLGLAACKELVRLAATDTAAAHRRLIHWQNTVFHSEDAKEGAQAFLERRAPVWRGR